MKRWLLASCLVASVGLAQEIGTEIAPVAPVSSASEQARPQQQVESATATATAGSFGIRAGFGSSGAVYGVGSTGGSIITVGAPFVGGSLLATNNLKLLVDVGFGFGASGSSAAWAFGAAVGVDFLFRTSADALRPLLYGSVSFGIAASGSGDPSSSFGLAVGGGAEYFLSRNFAFHGKIGISVPMSVSGGNFTFRLFSLTPGLGATFYF